jgi:hypothetical protein
MVVVRDNLGMKRLILAVIASCCVVLSPNTWADDAPFTPSQQYSADQTITTQAGQTVTSKIYMDSGKVRSEMSMQGMQVISIIRPDQKKMYSVMVASKMVMVMPLNPEVMKQQAATSAAEAKFETVGPDTVDGVACTKYKMTGKDNKVFFWWVNASTKTPVKMTDEAGTFTLVWSNYKVGPQDASLFEPPADYKTMDMPSAQGGGGQ